MNIHILVRFGALLFVMTALYGCNGETSSTEKSEGQNFTVRIWELTEPKGLNPHITHDMTALVMKQSIFQKMLDFDFDTYELTPVLAASRPEVTVHGDTAMELTFNLRPEAKWDNGEPITAEDVAFSFKSAIAPHVDNESLRPYLSFISDIILYEEDPLKITFLTDQLHMRAETTIGYEILVIPAEVYDPENVLANYTFKQLRDPALAENEDLQAFAESFNSEQYARDPEKIAGSGPYRVADWQTGQRIILERKDNWWGHEMKEPGNEYFEANPYRIIHEVISDQTGAITALKAGKLDVARSIKAKDFRTDFMGNENITSRYNLHTPPQFAYSFIGINLRNPKLSDKKTRQALAHLVNYDRLLEDITHGFAERVVGPVNPVAEKFYNKDIQPYQYNVERAKQLLAEAGWNDSNGDGILDKVINGRRTDLTITFLYNTGHQEREKIGLILQQSAKAAGVNIELQNIDGQVFLQRIRQHDFEIFYNAWMGEPAPEDYTQIWHTSSAAGGSNYVYFGNAQTDSLIDKINRTLDEDKRAELVKEFQSIIHEEVPYIFLWSADNRLAISKRFTNTRPSAYRPGFFVAGFELADEGEEGDKPEANETAD